MGRHKGSQLIVALSNLMSIWIRCPLVRELSGHRHCWSVVCITRSTTEACYMETLGQGSMCLDPAEINKCAEWTGSCTPQAVQDHPAGYLSLLGPEFLGGIFLIIPSALLEGFYDLQVLPHLPDMRKSTLHINTKSQRPIDRWSQGTICHGQFVPDAVLPRILLGQLFIGSKTKSHEVMLPVLCLYIEWFDEVQDSEIRDRLNITSNNIQQFAHLGSPDWIIKRRK